MHLLEDTPDLTQRELAKSLGGGGVNYFLKTLFHKGWVKMQNLSQSKKIRLCLHPRPQRHG
jgi:hypothetical protein